MRQAYLFFYSDFLSQKACAPSIKFVLKRQSIKFISRPISLNNREKVAGNVVKKLLQSSHDSHWHECVREMALTRD